MGTIINKQYLFIVMLCLCFAAYAFADDNKDTASSSVLIAEENATFESSGEETPAGLWKLNTIQTVKANDNWKGREGDLSLFNTWKDFLEIQHQVDCRLKWSSLPTQFRPGNEVRFSAEFISKEYSTTSSLQTGLKLTVQSYKPITIFDLKKNLDNHFSEARNTVIIVPKYNDNREFKIIIECYSGQNKYIVIYNYLWSSE